MARKCAVTEKVEFGRNNKSDKELSSTFNLEPEWIKPTLELIRSDKTLTPMTNRK